MPVRHARSEQARTISTWPYPMYVESLNAGEILSASPNNLAEWRPLQMSCRSDFGCREVLPYVRFAPESGKPIWDVILYPAD